MKKLLIVESPAKAKTIGKYLGSEFTVKSSVGHIRDLPKESGAIKIVPDGAGGWTFTPTYEISDGKKKVVAELKSAVKGCDEIYLASDPDREGEAIAWHLKEVLSPAAGNKPFRRVTYNEITKSAVLKAVEEPRDIDMPRVDAPQARRILDRLVGYKVSPMLWKSINCANNRTLSAGRVQSVALRLLVERQREIDAFKPETYYLLGVEAKKRGTGETFEAKLSRVDGKKPSLTDRHAIDNALLELSGAWLEVSDVKAQPKVRHALPPFTTSTLQQAASSVLGFSPGKTMKLAQSLYEQGLITYMRTDSVNVSASARDAAKALIEREYGEEFYPAKPNVFKSKGGAQEAHEAIRPTDVERVPGAEGMEAGEAKLYELVWKRFVASQMADARTTVRTAFLSAVKTGLVRNYVFTASVTDIDFEGFLRVMKLSSKKKAKDDEDDDDSDEVESLPALAKGEALDAARWLSEEKQTKGPKHYSEASLIKALEENGVGRPSTYAATIETLKLREYAKTDKRKLVPLERGILVCDWLVEKLNQLFSVGYTAEMEAELDKVEESNEPMNAMLSEFYAKFTAALEACKPPAPEPEKFKLVFSLLDQVKEWKAPVTQGKRVYDDKGFVESVKRGFESGKEMTLRQLEVLVRVLMSYASQVPDAEARLKDAKLLSGGTVMIERANPDLVRFCFQTLDRIAGLQKNSFLKSLREQFDRGKGLTMKQFGILARSVGENCGALPDHVQIREKLGPFVPGGFPEQVYDPQIEKVLTLLKEVTEWRPKTRRGRRVYDDKGFYESLAMQYSQRGMLSALQASALKQLARTYRTKIPDYDRKAAEIGLASGGEDAKPGDEGEK